MKATKDLKNKSKAELEEKRTQAIVGLKNFRFAIAGSKQKNVREGRNLRRTMARALTLIKQSNA